MHERQKPSPWLHLADLRGFNSIREVTGRWCVSHVIWLFHLSTFTSTINRQKFDSNYFIFQLTISNDIDGLHSTNILIFIFLILFIYSHPQILFLEETM